MAHHITTPAAAAAACTNIIYIQRAAARRCCTRMLLGAARAKTGGRINSNLCKLWRWASPPHSGQVGGWGGKGSPGHLSPQLLSANQRCARPPQAALLWLPTPRGPAKHFQVLRNVIKSKQKFFVGEEEKRNFALYRIWWITKVF